ncbi:uncharacterized protein LOC124795573, partial [Schistocerca piceifrons]|uniref:uncharacterized protein LOC124795573 n=1 Tax=Schistocerca piceifrons TaxID=274613 RepID=UPI001F5E3AC4
MPEGGLEPSPRSAAQSMTAAPRPLGYSHAAVCFSTRRHFDRTRGDEEVPSGGRFRVSENNNTVLLSVEGVSAADAGRYSLLAKNAAGEARAALELRVGRDAPCFLRRLSDLAVKVGTRTRFLVELKAPHDVKVTWLHEDRPLPQDDRFQLVREGGFFCVDVAPVTVHDSGRWTCLAENAVGRSCCSCTLNVLVPKAYKPPEFVEPLRALLSAAGTVSLECKVVGVPTPALRWLKDGKEIRAGDVLALTADPASLGTYTCEASNCMGRATSSSRVIVEGAAADSFRAAGPPPVFIKELQPAKCRIGDPLTLSCQVAVPPWPRAVSWYNSAGRVEPGERYLVREDGLGGFSVHVVAVEAADDGDWKCVATSDLGAAAFSRAAVAVHYPKNYRKPRFLESLKAVLTEEGLVSFECKVVGFPTPQLRWFKDGQELRPGDVYQLTGTNSLGSYSCIARNCMGEATSTAELTVEDIQSQLSDEERLALLSHNQAPRFIRGLKSCEARIDEPFRFTVQVTVSPEPVVTWYRDDDLVADSDRYEIIMETLGTVNLDVKRLEIVDQAEWKCVASNDFGHSVTSCFLKLVIPKHYKKPRFLECLRAILSEEGAVNLECKVIGVPQPVLKWYKDGAELKPGDIHRIISGQDGTCCLGTYTCEAHNCMGTVASSASLLGFEERVMKAEAPAMAVAAGAAAGAAHPLARNTSLSTIQEERTSQLCDVLSERPDLSFSFDGREVSVSLYETPDLTEEQALAVVEMYAEQLSEHVSEHNVVDLPPMRFTKESSQSGNLLMEAVVIDVSGEYFTTADEDLRTDADLEELSITDDNGQQPQLPRDDDTAAEASPPVRPPRANKQQSSADNTFHSLSDDTRYDSPASGGVSPPAAAAAAAGEAGVVRPKRRSVESGQGESFENLSSASEASVARPGQILRKGTLRKRSRSIDTAASAEDVSGGETPLPRRRQLSLDMEAPKDDSYSEEGDGLKTRLLRDAAGRRSAKTPSVESVREEEPLIPTTIVTEVESRQQQQQQQQQRTLDIDLPTLHAPPPPSLQEIQRGLAAVEEQVRSESASEPQLARTSLSVLETLSQPVEQLRRGLEQPEQLAVEQLAQPVQELRRGLQLVEQQRAVMAEEDDHSLLERTSASILETVAQPVRQLSQLLQQQSAEPAQGGAVSDRRLSQVSEQLQLQQLQQQQQQEAEPSAVLHGIARPVLELQRGLTFLQQQAVLEASGDTRLFENAGRSILSTLERPFQDLQRGIAALEEQVGGEGPSSGVLGASILEAVLSPLRELQSGIAEVQRQAATEAEEDGFEPDVKRYAVLKTLSGPVAELQRAVVEIGERFSVEAAVAGGGLTRRAVSVSKLAVLRGKTVSETEGLAVLGNLAPPLVKLQKEVIRAQNELRARPPEGGGGSEGGAEGAAEQAAAWGAVAVRALAKPLADFRRGLLAVERQLAAESEEEPIREGQIAAALRALADPVADLMRGIDGLQKAEVGQPNQELIQPFQELQRGLTQVQQVVFETSPELIPASGVVKKLTLSLQEVTKKLTDVDAAVVGSFTPETEPASKLTGLAQPMKQLKKGLVQIAQATSFSAEDIPAIATLVQPLVQLQKGLEKMERQLTAAAQSVDPTPEKKLTAIIEPIKEMQKGIRAIKRQAILEPQSTNMECLESLVQPFENLKRQLEEIERKRPESPGIRLLDEVVSAAEALHAGIESIEKHAALLDARGKSKLEVLSTLQEPLTELRTQLSEVERCSLEGSGKDTVTEIITISALKKLAEPLKEMTKAIENIDQRLHYGTEEVTEKMDLPDIKNLASPIRELQRSLSAVQQQAILESGVAQDLTGPSILESLFQPLQKLQKSLVTVQARTQETTQLKKSSSAVILELAQSVESLKTEIDTLQKVKVTKVKPEVQTGTVTVLEALKKPLEEMHKSVATIEEQIVKEAEARGIQSEVADLSVLEGFIEPIRALEAELKSIDKAALEEKSAAISVLEKLSAPVQELRRTFEAAEQLATQEAEPVYGKACISALQILSEPIRSFEQSLAAVEEHREAAARTTQVKERVKVISDVAKQVRRVHHGAEALEKCASAEPKTKLRRKSGLAALGTLCAPLEEILTELQSAEAKITSPKETVSEEASVQSLESLSQPLEAFESAVQTVQRLISDPNSAEAERSAAVTALASAVSELRQGVAKVYQQAVLESGVGPGMDKSSVLAPLTAPLHRLQKALAAVEERKMLRAVKIEPSVHKASILVLETICHAAEDLARAADVREEAKATALAVLAEPLLKLKSSAEQAEQRLVESSVKELPHRATVDILQGVAQPLETLALAVEQEQPLEEVAAYLEKVQHGIATLQRQSSEEGTAPEKRILAEMAGPLRELQQKLVVLSEEVAKKVTVKEVPVPETLKAVRSRVDEIKKDIALIERTGEEMTEAAAKETLNQVKENLAQIHEQVLQEAEEEKLGSAPAGTSVLEALATPVEELQKGVAIIEEQKMLETDIEAKVAAILQTLAGPAQELQRSLERIEHQVQARSATTEALPSSQQAVVSEVDREGTSAVLATAESKITGAWEEAKTTSPLAPSAVAVESREQQLEKASVTAVQALSEPLQQIRQALAQVEEWAEEVSGESRAVLAALSRQVSELEKGVAAVEQQVVLETTAHDEQAQLRLEVQKSVAALEQSVVLLESVGEPEAVRKRSLESLKAVVTPVDELQRSLTQIQEEVKHAQQVESTGAGLEIVESMAEPLAQLQRNLAALEQRVVAQVVDHEEQRSLLQEVAQPLHDLQAALVRIEQKVVQRGITLVEQQVILEAMGEPLSPSACVSVLAKLAEPLTELHRGVALVQQQVVLGERAEALSQKPAAVAVLARPLEEVSRGLAQAELQHLLEAPEATLSSASDVVSLLQTLAEPLRELERNVAQVQQQVALEAKGDSLADRTSASVLETLAQPLREVQRGIATVEQQAALEAAGRVSAAEGLSLLKEVAQPLRELQLAVATVQQQVLMEAKDVSISDATDMSDLKTEVVSTEEPLRQVASKQQADVLEARDASLSENEGVSALKTLATPAEEKRLALATTEQQIVMEGKEVSLSGKEDISALKAQATLVKETHTAAVAVEQQTALEAKGTSLSGTADVAKLKETAKSAEEPLKAVAIVEEHVILEAKDESISDGTNVSQMETLASVSDEPIRHVAGVLQQTALEARDASIAEQLGASELKTAAVSTEEQPKGIATTREEIILEGREQSLSDQESVSQLRTEALELSEAQKGIAVAEQQVALEAREKSLSDRESVSRLKEVAAPGVELREGAVSSEQPVALETAGHITSEAESLSQLKTVAKSAHEVHHGIATTDEPTVLEAAGQSISEESGISKLKTAASPTTEAQKMLATAQQEMVLEARDKSFSEAGGLSELKKQAESAQESLKQAAVATQHDVMETFKESAVGGRTEAEPETFAVASQEPTRATAVAEQQQVLEQREASLSEGPSVSQLKTTAESLKEELKAVAVAEQQVVLEGRGTSLADEASLSKLETLAMPASELAKETAVAEQQVVLEGGEVAMAEEASASQLQTLARPAEELHRALAAVVLQTTLEEAGEAVPAAPLLEALAQPLRELRQGLAVVEQQLPLEQAVHRPEPTPSDALFAVARPVHDLLEAVAAAEQVVLEGAGGGSPAEAAEALHALAAPVQQLQRALAAAEAVAQGGPPLEAAQQLPPQRLEAPQLARALTQLQRDLAVVCRHDHDLLETAASDDDDATLRTADLPTLASSGEASGAIAVADRLSVAQEMTEQRPRATVTEHRVALAEPPEGQREGAESQQTETGRVGGEEQVDIKQKAEDERGLSATESSTQEEIRKEQLTEEVRRKELTAEKVDNESEKALLKDDAAKQEEKPKVVAEKAGKETEEDKSKIDETKDETVLKSKIKTKTEIETETEIEKLQSEKEGKKIQEQDLKNKEKKTKGDKTEVEAKKADEGMAAGRTEQEIKPREQVTEAKDTTDVEVELKGDKTKEKAIQQTTTKGTIDDREVSEHVKDTDRRQDKVEFQSETLPVKEVDDKNKQKGDLETPEKSTERMDENKAKEIDIKAEVQLRGKEEKKPLDDITEKRKNSETSDDTGKEELKRKSSPKGKKPSPKKKTEELKTEVGGEMKTAEEPAPANKEALEDKAKEEQIKPLDDEEMRKEEEQKKSASKSEKSDAKTEDLEKKEAPMLKKLSPKKKQQEESKTKVETPKKTVEESDDKDKRRFEQKLKDERGKPLADIEEYKKEEDTKKSEPTSERNEEAKAEELRKDTPRLKKLSPKKKKEEDKSVPKDEEKQKTAEDSDLKNKAELNQISEVTKSLDDIAEKQKEEDKKKSDLKPEKAQEDATEEIKRKESPRHKKLSPKKKKEGEKSISKDEEERKTTEEADVINRGEVDEKSKEIIKSLDDSAEKQKEEEKKKSDVKSEKDQEASTEELKRKESPKLKKLSPKKKKEEEKSISKEEVEQKTTEESDLISRTELDQKSKEVTKSVGDSAEKKKEEDKKKSDVKSEKDQEATAEELKRKESPRLKKLSPKKKKEEEKSKAKEEENLKESKIDKKVKDQKEIQDTKSETLKRAEDAEVIAKKKEDIKDGKTQKDAKVEEKRHTEVATPDISVEQQKKEETEQVQSKYRDEQAKKTDEQGGEKVYRKEVSESKKQEQDLKKEVPGKATIEEVQSSQTEIPKQAAEKLKDDGKQKQDEKEIDEVGNRKGTKKDEAKSKKRKESLSETVVKKEKEKTEDKLEDHKAVITKDGEVMGEHADVKLKEKKEVEDEAQKLKKEETDKLKGKDSKVKSKEKENDLKKEKEEEKKEQTTEPDKHEDSITISKSKQAAEQKQDAIDGTTEKKSIKQKQDVVQKDMGKEEEGSKQKPAERKQEEKKSSEQRETEEKEKVPQVKKRGSKKKEVSESKEIADSQKTAKLEAKKDSGESEGKPGEREPGVEETKKKKEDAKRESKVDETFVSKGTGEESGKVDGEERTKKRERESSEKLVDDKATEKKSEIKEQVAKLSEREVKEVKEVSGKERKDTSETENEGKVRKRRSVKGKVERKDEEEPVSDTGITKGEDSVADSKSYSTEKMSDRVLARKEGVADESDVSSRRREVAADRARSEEVEDSDTLSGPGATLLPEDSDISLEEPSSRWQRRRPWRTEDRSRSSDSSATITSSSGRRPRLDMLSSSASKPQFVTRLRERSAAAGSRLRLVCCALGSPAPAFRWLKDGRELPAGERRRYRTACDHSGLATLEIFSAAPEDTGTYSCEASNEAGWASTSAELRVTDHLQPTPAPPTFTRAIRDSYRSSEDELVLECRVRSSPAPAVSWLKDGRPLPLAGSGAADADVDGRFSASELADGVCRLVVRAPSAHVDSGVYTCVARNELAEERVSANVVFPGRDQWPEGPADFRRPYFTSALSDHYVSSGATIALQVQIAGSPQPAVSWTLDGHPLRPPLARSWEESGVHTLLLSGAATPRDAGVYRCRAHNA